MRHQALGGAEDHDSIPLPPLDPVDRRQRDAALRPLAVEGASQPRLEGPGIEVEVGDLEEGLEIVEVRPAGTAGAVEEGHRRAEADVVAHRREQVARGGPHLGERGQPIEVGGEVVELLADLRVVDAGGGAPDVAHRTALVEPLRGPLREASARSSVHLAEVGAAHVIGVDGDAEVGERRPHPEPGQDALVEDRVDRHARVRQHHVRGQEQGLHPREHGHLVGLDLGLAPATPRRRRPAPARRCRPRGS